MSRGNSRNASMAASLQLKPDSSSRSACPLQTCVLAPKRESITPNKLGPLLVPRPTGRAVWH